MTEAFFAPRFEVRLSGLRLAADLADQVTSLVVETDLDLAGTFALTLRNPDNTLLGSALLDLGKTVEIHLGYGADLKPAFLGEVTAIEPSFPQDGSPTIKVAGYDKSYKMRRSFPTPVSYKFTNDSLIAAKLAVTNGLIPVVDPTPGLEKQVDQAGESDMAFLKARARKRFFDVYVEWDRLHFQFPRPRTAAHVLEWGKNLSSFSPRISAAGLAGLQVVRSYNQELAQTIYGAALALDIDRDNLIERLGSSALDLIGSMVRQGVLEDQIDNPLDALAVAKALLQNLLDGMYEGTGSCIGLPDLTAGDYLEIRGVGKRFGGTFRVRKVAHRIDGSGFTTDFSISQSGNSSLMGLLRKQVTKEPPPDAPKTFSGVAVGTVTADREIRDPPEPLLGRVKVKIPAISDEYVSSWAPCVRPMGGAGTGFYALPEEDEQVLVTFVGGDLNKPFVLGSMWNAKQLPPVRDIEGRNDKRVIKSRSGHTITFDDTKGAGKLVIEDSTGSAITLNAKDGSITIEAKQNLTIRAGGTLTLEAADKQTAILMDATQVKVT
jgi:phage protein D/phage baseplate assembly protein gpV